MGSPYCFIWSSLWRKLIENILSRIINMIHYVVPSLWAYYKPCSFRARHKGISFQMGFHKGYSFQGSPQGLFLSSFAREGFFYIMPQRLPFILYHNGFLFWRVCDMDMLKLTLYEVCLSSSMGFPFQRSCLKSQRTSLDDFAETNINSMEKLSMHWPSSHSSLGP